MAKLTFVLEDGQEVVVPLKEHITIGRAEDNDIVVDDERISSHHAEIVQNADGSLQVFDLKSTAGTFVNGESQLSCTLLHGDSIGFGPLVGMLDLEDAASIPKDPAPPPAAAEPEAPSRATVQELPLSTTQAAPIPDSALLEAVAKLEAEKSRLKVEVETAEKELRDWRQRAEKERALHFARVESLRAEEQTLVPVQAAVKQAESAHREWLDAISALTIQHENKATALERLNAQHYEKSTEVQRLTAAAAQIRQEIDQLPVQKEETTARLNLVRDECEQDEASLHRLQAELTTREKALAARTAELFACEKNFAVRSTELANEIKRISEARAQRAELEQQNQELAGTKQQLAEARQRLAAVEQRYRDALSNGPQGGSQIGQSRRQPAQEEPPKDAAPLKSEPQLQNGKLSGQIEAARRELAELEARIASLRDLPPPGGGSQSAGFPPPVVVQVETIKIAPVSIKSERTRGPGTKTAGAGKT